MRNHAERKRAGGVVIAFSIVLGVLNSMAVLLGGLMLVWTISELDYEGEQWGLVGVLVIGGVGMVVIILLLIGTIVFIAVSGRRLPLVLHIVLLLLILAGMALDGTALVWAWGDPDHEEEDYRPDRSEGRAVLTPRGGRRTAMLASRACPQTSPVGKQPVAPRDRKVCAGPLRATHPV